MMVDSNLGYNKVDPNIRRQAAYAVTLDSAGAARATLTITYTNLSSAAGADCAQGPHYLPSYIEMQQGCYRDYVRVVVPARSQLLGATSSVQQADDLIPGRTSFGGYFILPSGETRSIRFDYNLPPGVGNQTDYTLHLEKQPGAPTIPVAVRVSFPTGWSIKSASPAPTEIAEDYIEFDFTLDRDQEIQIDFGRLPVSLVQWIVGGTGLIFAVALIRWLNQQGNRKSLIAIRHA
jgi:hypothetical protein